MKVLKDVDKSYLTHKDVKFGCCLGLSGLLHVKMSECEKLRCTVELSFEYFVFNETLQAVRRLFCKKLVH